ncbi:MAG: hypothetical protein LYZ70_07920 [Nitrososphaerales archaeon]|nr:hypothetical protein [Nitrososphaerales archaeon]
MSGSTASNQNGRALRLQMLVTLLFLFLVFVALDVVTTVWLVQHTPGGIQNEINPTGVLLYNTFGTGGMIFAKFALFILFGGMVMFFSWKYTEVKWFTEVAQTLVLVQIAISLVVAFNNFIAILATFYVGGIWPLVSVSPQEAVIGIYAADLLLGAAVANGIMYTWGVVNRQTHMKIFVSLMVFVTPVLLFSSGFKANIWLFALYVASASSAVSLFFYATEARALRAIVLE